MAEAWDGRAMSLRAQHSIASSPENVTKELRLGQRLQALKTSSLSREPSKACTTAQRGQASSGSAPAGLRL